jgi:hypothetical protein
VEVLAECCGETIDHAPIASGMAIHKLEPITALWFLIPVFADL